MDQGKGFQHGFIALAGESVKDVGAEFRGAEPGLLKEPDPPEKLPVPHFI